MAFSREAAEILTQHSNSKNYPLKRSLKEVTDILTKVQVIHVSFFRPLPHCQCGWSNPKGKSRIVLMRRPSNRGYRTGSVWFYSGTFLIGRGGICWMIVKRLRFIVSSSFTRCQSWTKVLLWGSVLDPRWRVEWAGHVNMARLVCDPKWLFEQFMFTGASVNL